jgi:hypothetical protein
MTTLDFGNRRTPTGIILGRHGDSSYLLHGRNIKACGNQKKIEKRSNDAEKK